MDIMRIFLAAALLLLAPATAWAAEPLSISGLVAKPARLTMAELRKLPARRVAVKQTSKHGAVPLNCSGPALTAVLDRVKLSLPPGKNVALRHTLLFTASDGYAVVLSLGEIDPDYGNAAPVLATECDGKPLDAPRLVMPGDKSASRSVYGLTRIQVR